MDIAIGVSTAARGTCCSCCAIAVVDKAASAATARKPHLPGDRFVVCI
jgi:hypothetical protein